MCLPGSFDLVREVLEEGRSPAAGYALLGDCGDWIVRPDHAGPTIPEFRVQGWPDHRLFITLDGIDSGSMEADEVRDDDSLKAIVLKAIKQGITIRFLVFAGVRLPLSVTARGVSWRFPTAAHLLSCTRCTRIPTDFACPFDSMAFVGVKRGRRRRSGRGVATASAAPDRVGVRRGRRRPRAGAGSWWPGSPRPAARPRPGRHAWGTRSGPRSEACAPR